MPTIKNPEPIAPVNGSLHRRNRCWERQRLSEKVVYRGVHPGFVQEVQRLSKDLLMPAGQVARSILEYSLRKYEEGLLALLSRPDPKRLRMTLQPVLQTSRKNPTKQKIPIQPETSWRQITTWRNFPPELKRTISALASKEALNVPVGELVNALFRHGLNAYRAGLLKLEPIDQATAPKQPGKGKV